MAEKHMLESSSGADFEGANSDQKRIKLEEQQTQGKVSDSEASAALKLEAAGKPLPGHVTWDPLLFFPLQGGGPDPHNTPPSRVVHARAVPDGCTHQQMIASLSKFGKIS